MSIALAAYIITSAVNLQVPLYPAYATRAGYGIGVLSLVFSCYVAGLLPVLIFLGGISDRIGRKSPLLLALGCATLATVAVLLHPTLATLVFARVLQGIGVGLGVGASTAFLAELLDGPDAPQRAAAYVSAATALGFGSGALVTSFCMVFQSTLTPISYYLFPPLALISFAAVARISERRVVRAAAWIRLPYFRRQFLPQSLAIFFAWAITGMVIAVVPAQLAKHELVAWTGVALFLVNGVGALCQPIARTMNANRALKLGLFLAPSGYAMLALGAGLGRVWLVLAGAAVAGSACYGFIYLGGLASVTDIEPHHRARAASGYFLFAYLGFSLPVIVSGFLSDWLGALASFAIFGVLTVAGNIVIAYSVTRSARHGSSRHD